VFYDVDILTLAAGFLPETEKLARYVLIVERVTRWSKQSEY